MGKKPTRTICAALVLELLSSGWTIKCVAAPPQRNKAGAAGSFAIAQFIDGRFQVIYLGGNTREFDKTEHYFLSARFSANGSSRSGELGLILGGARSTF